MSDSNQSDKQPQDDFPEIHLSIPGDHGGEERAYPILLGLDGNLKAQRFQVDKKVVTIGRNMSADIVPHDSHCARRHAYVIYTNIDEQQAKPLCRLHDVGIGSGTFVNEERITQEGYVLHENDRIRIGNTNLVFLLHENGGESLEHKVEDLTLRDQPTGLLYFHIFRESLVREMARSHRYHRDLSLLLLHINNLTPIRDRFGVQVSNRILSDLGNFIQGFLRANDMPARHTHDELVILMPETDLDGARSAADRLLCAVENETFRHGDEDLTLGLKVGVTVWNEEVRTPEELLERTEQALKEADEQTGGRMGWVG